MKIARFVSLCLLAVLLFVTVDLGLNYFNATFTDLNDGIVCISVFKPFFGDSLWSLQQFFNAFSISLWVTLFVAVGNIVLACISILKGNRHVTDFAE